jgi:DNA-binding CsgD family transcriptional regulator
MDATLSKTEQQMIELRISGQSRKEIASKTFRSELTIKTHFQNISRKLDCKDEIEMVVKYLRKYKGIIFIIAGTIAGVIFRNELNKIVEYLKACINGF